MFVVRDKLLVVGVQLFVVRVKLFVVGVKLKLLVKLFVCCRVE